MTDLTYRTPTARPVADVLPWVILPVWFTAIVALVDAGVFADASTPYPFRLLPAVLLPPLAFLVVSRLSPALRTWVATRDLALVVGAQSFRVIGIVFLFLWALGDVPAAFALPAGLGDIVVGVLALGLAIRVASGSTTDGDVRRLVGFGMADFAIAFTMATLCGPGMPFATDPSQLPLAAQTLPMALIPVFAVPLFIILHLMSLPRRRRGL